MTSEPLYLTLLRQDNTIVSDFTQVDTIVPRSQLSIEEGLLTEINEELARITSLANKRLETGPGHETSFTSPASGFHNELKRLGELIFFHLFAPPARQRLLESPPSDLFLRLDDQLVHVPWELAFDGQNFLLNKFRIGRQVLTHQAVPPPDVRRPKEPHQLKMLIVADPTDSLEAAAEEAEQLADMLDTCENLDVSILGGKQLRKIELLQALNECDLVHYAGHASFDEADPSRSGWVLQDSILTASELRRVPHPPFLVFANACQAGVTTRWQSAIPFDDQAFGIGSGFLLAGTQNYIGTFCAIHDAHSATFAADFYRHILQGEKLGHALAKARQRAFQEAETSGLLWASYMHYGNPTFEIPLSPEEKIPQAAPLPAQLAELEAEVSDPPLYTPQEAVLRSSETTTYAEPQATTPVPEALPSQAAPPAIETPLAAAPIAEMPQHEASRRKFPRLLATIGAVAAVLISIALFVLREQTPTPLPSAPIPIAAQAYSALEEQDWPRAKTLFQQLRDDADPKTSSQGYAGLSAIAYAEKDTTQWIALIKEAQKTSPHLGYGYALCGQAAVDYARGKYQLALGFAQKAQTMSIPYCYLIQGHILAQQGQADAAAAAYQQAIDLPESRPWQHKIANNRLQQLSSLPNVTRSLQDTTPKQ